MKFFFKDLKCIVTVNEKLRKDDGAQEFDEELHKSFINC